MKYLFWAYTATWMLLFAYTLSLGRRQNKIAQDLDRLKKIIGEEKQR